MASRSLVSYDDITLPYDPPQSMSQPPKKRKRNNKKASHHKDDSTPAHDVLPNEESRELTNEEIWDDSALIDAWNAAMEEYEVYHGPDKGWKKEPVHKSPLWYNIPPSKPSTNLQHRQETTNDESDSKPIDFDTYVPTHDPTLFSLSEEDHPITYNPNVSQDEAFERAVQASYWSGYWTAIYHSLRQNQPEHADAEQDGEDEDEDEDVFVSTQR